ncbi:hypothetical protein FJT64_006265 [Amphibalanus amphitrite]|uniref:Fibrinogen C-terminal domain-containing protein n=1 Tax=Amphibalanus amphitrite TaxID=1232801 RepID=A0A6A4VQ57_AMPAM|nr:hypothetical protein FJT64_006265 [Amphibalanus amphitrite]
MFRVCAVVLFLVTLTAAHPTEQPLESPQPPAADQPAPPAVSYQPSAAEQLSALLSPLVEGAVSRAQCGWQLAQLAGRLERLQAGADAGHRALAELTRQQLRLDSVVHDVTALQLSELTRAGQAVPVVRGEVCQPPQERRDGKELSAAPEPVTNMTKRHIPQSGAILEQQPELEPGPEPVHQVRPTAEVESEADCEAHPAALPAHVAAYQEPETRACARSCLQLRNQGVAQDGVYWLTGLPVPVLCDFSHDDGGWTLLLTAVSRDGWDPYSVLGRSELSPSLTDNYSILRHADTIRDLGSGTRFAYRIETQAEKGRQRWGGIWFAPKHYSFVDETALQTNVSLMKRFDVWVYQSEGIKRRMPWINTWGYHEFKPVLTTATKDVNFWGTLVTHSSEVRFSPSPWHPPSARDSGTVLYWMREEVF